MSGDEAAAWERREDGQRLPDYRAERAQNGDLWKQEHVAWRGVTADPYWSTKVAQALCTPRHAPCAAKRRRGCAAAACRSNNADRRLFVVLHATICVTALRRFLTVLRCRALVEDESKSR
jgi:hypothetical protein